MTFVPIGGLATSYAASRMKEGAARTAVEYGGGILGGASAGAMFGPWGALVGAAGGAAATYLKRDEAQRAAAEDFRKYDDGFQENRLWNARMRGLTEVEPSAVGLPEEAAAKDRIAKLEAKIAEARAIELRQFDEENATVAKIRGHLKKGEVAAAATAEEELRVRRARREQVEGIRRAFEQEKKGVERAEAERSAKAAKAEDTRTDTTGTDALARADAGWGAAAAPEAVRSPKSGIGLVVRKAAAEAAEAAGGPQFGGFSVASRKTAEFKFGGSDGESTSRSIKAANEILARQNEKMIAALQEIERNTKGGSAWQ